MTLVSALLAFIVTVVFLFVLRPVAIAVGLVDVPGGRKRHDDIVPIVGGVAMTIGLAFGAGLSDIPSYWGSTLFAIYLLTVVGAIDDKFDLPANVRLIAQVCAALLGMLASNAIVTNVGSVFVIDGGLGVLAMPFSVLFVLTIVNAFNLIDGIDGLAAGLALLALGALMIVGAGSPPFTLAAIGAAVVAGFLLFNLPLGFNRAVRTFMGDAGSTSLGLVIALVGVHLSQGADARIAPVVGLWFVAVPVFDLFSAIVRRLMEGRSPFASDNEHLHHVLTDNGLSRRATLGWMLGMAIASIGIGLVGDWLRISDSAMLVLWVVGGVLYYQLMRRPGIVVLLHNATWPTRDRYVPGKVDLRE